MELQVFYALQVLYAEEVAFLQRRKRKVHGIPQVKILDSLSLLQGIFPTQGLNAGLLHCRQILYQLNHKGQLLPIQENFDLRECQSPVNWELLNIKYLVVLFLLLYCRHV